LPGRPAPPARPLPAAVDAKFVQVSPAPKDAFTFQRSLGQARVVVLIHGLRLHPFSNDSVNRAAFHDWQKAGSALVQHLARQADVFAFAYSENVPVEQVAETPGLAVNIWRLRQLGYAEVVLVGHSAGGLVARQFVEDHPGAGVTKVIQVCSPNGGCAYARVEAGVRKNQRPFLSSLTKQARGNFLKARAGRQIPAAVQFVCVVGDGARLGDGVVSNASQWPADLQFQGIPAVVLRTTHFTAMRTTAEAERLADLIRQSQPRWGPAQVAAVRKELWKD
jgi:pimeloyl-ACP methyl ester carboxylesterase